MNSFVAFIVKDLLGQASILIAFIAMLGLKPLTIIVAAQVANAILLPVIAIALFSMVNGKFLGRYRNAWYSNLAALTLIAITFVLASSKLLN